MILLSFRPIVTLSILDCLFILATRCTVKSSMCTKFGTIDMTDKDVMDTCKDGVYNASEFAKAQIEDDTLSDLWHRAKAGSSELCIRDGLLYKRISPSITSPHELALVMPVRYQREIHPPLGQLTTLPQTS